MEFDLSKTEPKLKFKPHIRRESRAEARGLADEYDITDSGGLRWLEIYADADTTVRDGEDAIKKDGMTFLDRFGQAKAHPLLSVIRDARAQKMAALKALCLDMEPLNDRPGRPGGR